jgi:hypothetical protein
VRQMKAQVRHLCGKEHIVLKVILCSTFTFTFTSIYIDTHVYIHTCLHLFPVLSTNAVAD